MVRGTEKWPTYEAFVSFWVWGPATVVALFLALLAHFDNAPTRWLEGQFEWIWARVIIAIAAFTVTYLLATVVYLLVRPSQAERDPPDELPELKAAENPTTTDEVMGEKLRGYLTVICKAIGKARRDLVGEDEYNDIQAYYHVASVRGLKSLVVSTLNDLQTMLGTAGQHWVEPIRNFRRVLDILAQVEEDLLKARTKHLKKAFMVAGGQMTAALDIIGDIRQQTKGILAK